MKNNKILTVLAIVASLTAFTATAGAEGRVSTPATTVTATAKPTISIEKATQKQTAISDAITQYKDANNGKPVIVVLTAKGNIVLYTATINPAFTKVSASTEVTAVRGFNSINDFVTSDITKVYTDTAAIGKSTLTLQNGNLNLSNPAHTITVQQNVKEFAIV
jgi:hypothetical protein